MSKEAMQLALEALETERNNYQDWDEEDGAPEYIHEAITALQEALAEQPAQQQEPVAGLLVGQDSDGRYVSIAAKTHADTLPLGEYKLYTTPPAQHSASR